MITFKIIDERQYILSPTYNNLDINLLIENHSTWDSYAKDVFNFWSCADKIETTTSCNKGEKYIVPMCYIHQDEALYTAKHFVEVAKQFVEDYTEMFKFATLAIVDPFESSQHFIDSVDELKKHFDIDIIGINPNKRYADGIYTDTGIHKFIDHGNPISFTDRKLYINLNNAAHYHRCKMLDALIENNLHSIGYNTCHDVYGQVLEYKKHNETRIDKIQWDVLDSLNKTSGKRITTVPYRACTQSFLWLVVETNVDSDNMFFTEKIYKPIALGMPFMVLGNPGMLADLQRRGYKTFSEFWNEDYDKDLPLDDKIKIIIDNLKTLTKQNLKELRVNMKSYLLHNRQVYNEERSKNELRKNLKDHLNV